MTTRARLGTSLDRCWDPLLWRIGVGAEPLPIILGNFAGRGGHPHVNEKLRNCAVYRPQAAWHTRRVGGCVTGLYD